MMMSSEAPPVKRDMLSLTSTVQEILRAMYFYSTDYMMVLLGKRERLLHKEQLVALLEQGREKATLEDMMSVTLNEPLSAKMQMEDLPGATPVLIFTQATDDAEGELSRTTLEGYREQKLMEAMVSLPEWWGIPLPLLHVRDDRVFFNERAMEMVPGGPQSVARQLDKVRDEQILVVRDKKRERTLSLSPLTDDTYLMEDISGDFEMAEDLVWWAAIGKAFVRRVEGNGLVIKRLSPYEEPLPGAAEIIPCSWEGEAIGSLAIMIPHDETPAEAAEAEAPPQTVPEVEPAPELEPEPKPTKPAASGRRRKKVPPEEAPEPEPADTVKLDTSAEVLTEGQKVPDSVSKNAARKAYGGKNAAVRRQEAPRATKPEDAPARGGKRQAGQSGRAGRTSARGAGAK